jgi:ATP-dependent DNA ligase
MTETRPSVPSWWLFPFKPVRVRESIFESIDPQKYILEKKYDGWRALLIAGPVPILWTREKTRIDMPDNLRPQIESLNLPDGTVLDGEIWTPEKRGAWRHNKGVDCRLTLWDAIRSGKRDLSALPLEARRTELESLLGAGTRDVGIVEWLPADAASYATVRAEAESFREQAQSRSGFIHGAVLKRRGSPRRDHAVRCVEHADWLKIVVDGMNSGA